MSQQAIRLIKECLELKNISLGLNSCRLSDKDLVKGSEVHKLLEECIHVKALDLSSNDITEIKGFEQLVKLEVLNISYNKLSEIKGLDQFTSLRLLYIANNEITELKGLNQLTSLQVLAVSNNKIQNLSPLLIFLKRKISPLRITLDKSWAVSGEINVAGNPVTAPPLEVINQGHNAIIRYLEKIQSEGREQVYEAKLVLTGSGESGKTSLSLRLIDKECPLPKKDERTKDVEVIDYKFKTKKRNDFTAHIWDFGGQQILHNFHRLFMNDSALYILITETSRENDDFDYWLQTIQLFGSESPILFVQNKRNGIPRRLNISNYKEHFNIKDDLYEINLLNKNEGLKSLESAIQKHIQQLPIVQRTIPKSWFRLRKVLEEVQRPFINYNEFVSVCEECNIIETIDIEDVGNFLHQLGILLWYKDNPALRDKIILERHWATKALFQLVFDEKINGSQKGYFTKADAQVIWDADLESDYKRYTAQLIALMQEFKLAYRQRNKKDSYIIPALLSATMPDKQFADNSRITVIYEYLHLPRGLVNQLTAELYEKIENNEYTWSEGVWLKEGNTEARVMEIVTTEP